MVTRQTVATAHLRSNACQVTVQAYTVHNKLNCCRAEQTVRHPQSTLTALH